MPSNYLRFTFVSPRTVAAIAGAAMVLVSSMAYALYAKAGESSVKVSISATGGITFTAKTGDMTVVDDGTNVTFTVPVASLKTGIGMRDSHLQKYLGADKSPNVTLALSKADVKLPNDGASLNGTVGSNITLHGVTKNQQVAYTIARAGARYQVHVDKLTVKLSDYGIAQPSFAGVSVKDEVSVAADVPLTGP